MQFFDGYSFCLEMQKNKNYQTLSKPVKRFLLYTAEQICFLKAEELNRPANFENIMHAMNAVLSIVGDGFCKYIVEAILINIKEEVDREYKISDMNEAIEDLGFLIEEMFEKYKRDVKIISAQKANAKWTRYYFQNNSIGSRDLGTMTVGDVFAHPLAEIFYTICTANKEKAWWNKWRTSND